MGTRRKEIVWHRTEAEIDRLLASANDAELLRRLVFLKNLARGDTIKEAAERVGRSEATGDRWANAWNDGGLEGLAPEYGGGRPPKLDEHQRQELLETLRDGQPWTPQEIQDLLAEEFDVEYHPTYQSAFLRTLGLSYSRSQTTQQSGEWTIDEESPPG